MAEIALISCGKRKVTHAAAASDLYIGTLFKMQLKYAKKLGAERIFILSAKYGLLHLDDIIEPYDVTLNRMPNAERKAWAKRVVDQLRNETDLENDHFTILAGLKYREFILPYMKSYEVPLEGKWQGQQMQFLKGA